MTDSRWNRLVTRTLVVCGCALSVWGCDRRSETHRKVDDASRELAAMSGGGSSAAPDGVRQKTYSKMSTEMNAAAKDGSGGEKAAAELLDAQAQMGLADMPAAQAAELEGRVRYAVVLVHTDLGRWAGSSATAAAADSYDASRQLAEIAASKAAKDKQIAEETARKQAIERELADLSTRAKQKLDAATAKYAEYSARVQAASKLSATQATPAVEQAVVIKNEGDALRLDGSKLQAQADSISPRLSEVNAIIAKLSKQKTDLDAIAASLQERTVAAKKEASDARAAAAAAAADLRKRLDELDALRKGGLATAYDQALGGYRKAGSLAKAAQGGGKPAAAKIAAAMAALSQAEMFWSRAQGSQTFASLLKTLASAQPSLPYAAEMQTRLTDTLKSQKDDLASAQASLEEAKAAFTTSGVGGGVKERLDALGELLDKAINVTKDEKLDAAGAFGFRTRVPADLAPAASAAPAAPAAAPAGDDEAQVRAELDKLFAAAAEGQKHMARAEAACKAKFNKSFAEVLASNPMLGASAGMIQKAMSLKPSDFRITITDDTATATAPGLPGGVPFTKVNGKWTAPSAGPAAQTQELTKAAGQAFDEWAADIEAGKFADETAASTGLMTKMQAVMMKMMGDMSGGK